MELSEIKSKLNAGDKVGNISRRTKKNTLLSFFFQQLHEDMYLKFWEQEKDVISSAVRDVPQSEIDEKYYVRVCQIKRRIDRVRLCSRFWEIDYFRFQGVKDLVKTSLCHDRFCENCQNALAIQRDRKYTPVLDELSEVYDLYHIVLTVPNVHRLSTIIDKMFSAFKKLVGYFAGRKKIRNVDFSQYGYVGAIRSLEITRNKSDGSFHPHFHCVFVMKKGLKLDKINKRTVNAYSFQNPDIKSHKKNVAGEPQRIFSDFEILIQKVWRLLIDGKEVNKDNIDYLVLGYSCICENANGRYKEVFKYATKGFISADDSKNAMANYESFAELFVALDGRRLIQGYGLLNKLIFADSIDTAADDLYLNVLIELCKLESPERVVEAFNFIEQAVKSQNITYISRSSIRELLGDDYEKVD